MPAEFKVLPERRLVCSRGSGVFTAEEYMAQMKEFFTDPAFNPDFDHLVDCRAITSMAINGEQMRALGSRSAFSASSKRAFVVSSDVQYGMSRMLATYREAHARQEIQVFREMTEALAWLGLRADFSPFEPETSGSNTIN